MGQVPENTVFSEDQLDQFQQSGWLTYDHFISDQTALQIREFILSKSVGGALRRAAIGRSDQLRIATEQRGDFIEWVDPSHAPEPVTEFFNRMDEVVTILNRSFFLGLRSLESHYTCYPENTRYERHSDRHKSGSSRVVSFVLYLNPEWEPEHGGKLAIYLAEKETVRIEPTFGRLALFLSELEHEVERTEKPRISITGWLRNEIELEPN